MKPLSRKPPHLAAILAPLQHLPSVPAPTRMSHLRRNLRQRHHHKSSLQHARMRHLQLLRLDRLRPVQQNVQVNQSRPLGKFLFAAHPTFNAAQHPQQFQRTKIRFPLQNSVQKPILLQIIEWLRFVNARNLFHHDSCFPQQRDRPPQIFLAVAHIRSQRDVYRNHLLHANPPPHHAQHRASFRQFQHTAHREKYHSINSQHHNRQRDRPALPQKSQHTTARRRSQQRRNPNLRQERNWHAYSADSLPYSALQQSEFHPRSNPRGNR